MIQRSGNIEWRITAGLGVCHDTELFNFKSLLTTCSEACQRIPENKNPKIRIIDEGPRGSYPENGRTGGHN